MPAINVEIKVGPAERIVPATLSSAGFCAKCVAMGLNEAVNVPRCARCVASTRATRGHTARATSHTCEKVAPLRCTPTQRSREACESGSAHASAESNRSPPSVASACVPAPSDPTSCVPSHNPPASSHDFRLPSRFSRLSRARSSNSLWSLPPESRFAKKSTESSSSASGT